MSSAKADDVAKGRSCGLVACMEALSAFCESGRTRIGLTVSLVPRVAAYLFESVCPSASKRVSLANNHGSTTETIGKINVNHRDKDLDTMILATMTLATRVALRCSCGRNKKCGVE